MIAPGDSIRGSGAGGQTPPDTQGRGRGRPRKDGVREAVTARQPRPAKPYKSFPLTPHRNGQFCKKIHGKLFYFGLVSDPEGSLRRYHEYCESLHAGKLAQVPREDALTIGELANRFMAAAEQRRTAGDLAPRTFVDYYRDCGRLVKFFGKDRAVESITKDDFKAFKAFLQKSVKPSTLKGRVGVTRSIFKFAFDEELIDTMVRFGRDFRRPEQRVLRLSRAQAGRKHLFAEEIQSILAVAPPQLRAMILLGVNCAFGNKDCAELQTNNIDLDHGWVYFPRVKTGIDRRCPLWPETIEAIRAVLADPRLRRIRRLPEATDKLFVTRQGHKFVRGELSTGGDGRPHLIEHDAIATSFKRLMEKRGIRLRGIGFYGLRHTLETIGAETGNQVAVDYIMGHAPPATDMGDVYRGGVADSALRQVTDHVHTWLFGREAGTVGGTVAAVRSSRGRLEKKTSARPAGKRVAARSGPDHGRSGVPGKPAGRPAGS